MKHTTREDMVVLRMGLDTLLECVRQTETWWRLRGEGAAMRRARLLGYAILATRRKFFAGEPEPSAQITEALFVAQGLREAAHQCQEGQAALHARLTGGAETIERLCRSRGGKP